MSKVIQEVNEIEKELYSIHNDILGYMINHRDQSYWTNLISSGLKSIDDYKLYLITSDNYLNNIQYRFKSLFYSIIGYDAHFDDDELDNLTMFVQNFINENSKELSNNDLKKYISSLDSFNNHYKPIIHSSMDNLTNEKYDYIINKFINEFDCDVDKLENYLKNIDKDIYLQSYNNNQSLVVETMIDNMMNTLLESNNESILNKDNKIELNRTALKEFSNVFNRQMFVEEYFFYVVKDIKYDVDEFNEYKSVIERLYKQYLDRVIDEYSFSIEYITHKDKGTLESLENHTLEVLIASDIYYNRMKAFIKEKYRLLYTTDIENSDLEYFFFKAKAEKLYIADVRLEEMIILWKNQTDTQIYEIYEIYLRILDRKPDSNEINDILYKYRYSDINPVEYMEKSIIQSFEFNDIMRKLISDKYKDNTDKDILPSLLYGMIKRIREEHIKEDTTFDEIHKLIDLLVITII